MHLGSDGELAYGPLRGADLYQLSSPTVGCKVADKIQTRKALNIHLTIFAARHHLGRGPHLQVREDVW